MNYEEMPTRMKETSDGEKARRCWCSGRCVVHYDENQWYRVECERCGSVMGFRAPSHDFAIKFWNTSPNPIRHNEPAKEKEQETLSIDFMLDFCEQAAETVHKCLDQAYASGRIDGNHYSAIAYFMAKEDFYRWEAPSLIRSMAEEAKKQNA